MPRSKHREDRRREFTAEELPEPARLRLENAGRWVAWSEDMTRIVATADAYEPLRATLAEAGMPGAIVEWLPPLDRAWSAGG